MPTLAIHLTKGDERGSFSPNLQNNFFPVLATEVKAKLAAAGKGAEAAEEGEGGGGGSSSEGGEKDDRHHALLVEMLAAEMG